MFKTIYDIQNRDKHTQHLSKIGKKEHMSKKNMNSYMMIH